MKDSSFTRGELHSIKLMLQVCLGATQKVIDKIEYIADCSCGGQGFLCCWDSTDSMEEGYTIQCEDCNHESNTFDTEVKARKAWNEVYG